MRTRLLAIAAMFSTVAVVSGTIVTSGRSQAAHDNATQAPLSDPSKAFGVLREARGTPADLSAVAGIRETLREQEQSAESSGYHPPEDFDEIREARTTRPSTAVETTVAASPRAVCLGVRALRGIGSSLACTAAESAVAPDRPIISTSFLGDGRWSISGLVVDGVDAFTVTTRAGARDVEVIDNTFVVEVTGDPETVAWTRPDGQRQTLDISGSAR